MFKLHLKFNRFFAVLTFIAFTTQSAGLFVSLVQAQEVSNSFLPDLPQVGSKVAFSQKYDPLLIQGVKIDRDNPLRLEFILNAGDVVRDDARLEEETAKIVKYFLATLTIPKEDMWVNLSPYEKDRIIPSEFGFTEMGRDLLAQDYLLKQVTATAMFPE